MLELLEVLEAVLLSQLHLLPHARLQNLQSDGGAVQAGLPWPLPLHLPGCGGGAHLAARQVDPGLGVPQIGLLLTLSLGFLWPTMGGQLQLSLFV